MEEIIHYPPGERPKKAPEVSHKNDSHIPLGNNSERYPKHSLSQDQYGKTATREFQQTIPAGMPSHAKPYSEIIFSNDKCDFSTTAHDQLRGGAVKQRGVSERSAGLPNKPHEEITFQTEKDTKALLNTVSMRTYISPKDQPKTKLPTYSTTTARGTFDVINNDQPITSDIFGFERYRPDQKRSYVSLSTTEQRRMDDPTFKPSSTRTLRSSDPWDPAPPPPPKPAFRHPLGDSSSSSSSSSSYQTRSYGDSTRGRTRAESNPQYFLKQSSYNIITGQ